MKQFSRHSGLWSIFVCVVILIVLAAIAIPNFVREPRTGLGNQIVNRLREIDRAKVTWATDHEGVGTVTLSKQDLKPYLSQGFWKKTVAGEHYLIHALDDPSEAVMTRDVEWIPKGIKVRDGPDRTEVRPSALEPMATAPSVLTNK
jgi:hypothetical protein